jgi:hypothetical protein
MRVTDRTGKPIDVDAAAAGDRARGWARRRRGFVTI